MIEFVFVNILKTYLAINMRSVNMRVCSKTGVVMSSNKFLKIKKTIKTYRNRI